MSLRYLKGVVTLQLNEERCSGCGMCTQVCVHGVFAVNEGVAYLVDKDGCMECGACARNCPANVVAVRSGVGCAYAVWRGWFRRKKEGGGVSPACS